MSDPDFSGWLTKQEAAVALGVSTKTVEAFAKDRKIQQGAWKPQGRGAEKAVYNPDDVARLAQERRPGLPAFVLPPSPTGNGNGNGQHAATRHAVAETVAAFRTAEDDPIRQLFAAALRAVLAPPVLATSENSEKAAYVDKAEALAIAGVSYGGLIYMTPSHGELRFRGWRAYRLPIRDGLRCIEDGGADILCGDQRAVRHDVRAAQPRPRSEQFSVLSSELSESEFHDDARPHEPRFEGETVNTPHWPILTHHECRGLPWVVYLVKSADQHKIGMTWDLRQRLKGLRNSSAVPVKRVGHVVVCCVLKARQIERGLHEKYAAERHHGEWFTLTEWHAKEITAFLNSPFVNERRRRRSELSNERITARANASLARRESRESCI